MLKLIAAAAIALAIGPAAAEPAETYWNPAATSQELTYEQMARTPTLYVDHYVSLHGKVVQRWEDENQVVLLININPGIVIAGYPKPSDIPIEPRILENDDVEFYGRFLELDPYDSIFRRQVTGPLIQIENIQQVTPELVRQRADEQAQRAEQDEALRRALERRRDQLEAK